MKIQPKFHVRSVSVAAVYSDTYNEKSHFWWESVLHPTNGIALEAVTSLATNRPVQEAQVSNLAKQRERVYAK